MLDAPDGSIPSHVVAERTMLTDSEMPTGCTACDCSICAGPRSPAADRAGATVTERLPPESPAAADKENTPPGKAVADGSPPAKPGFPTALSDEALTASPPAAIESSVVAVVGSTSCSPDKGASASGPAAGHTGDAAAEVKPAGSCDTSFAEPGFD